SLSLSLHMCHRSFIHERKFTAYIEFEIFLLYKRSEENNFQSFYIVCDHPSVFLRMDERLWFSDCEYLYKCGSVCVASEFWLFVGEER
ncbi:hypothetical protein, partial [Candidatus Cardinium sp. cBcalN1]